MKKYSISICLALFCINSSQAADLFKDFQSELQNAVKDLNSQLQKGQAKGEVQGEPLPPVHQQSSGSNVQSSNPPQQIGRGAQAPIWQKDPYSPVANRDAYIDFMCKGEGYLGVENVYFCLKAAFRACLVKPDQRSENASICPPDANEWIKRDGILISENGSDYNVYNLRTYTEIERARALRGSPTEEGIHKKMDALVHACARITNMANPQRTDVEKLRFTECAKYASVMVYKGPYLQLDENSTEFKDVYQSRRPVLLKIAEPILTQDESRAAYSRVVGNRESNYWNQGNRLAVKNKLDRLIADGIKSKAVLLNQCEKLRGTLNREEMTSDYAVRCDNYISLKLGS